MASFRSTQSLTEMSRLPGIFPVGKGSRWVGLTNLPPSYADCLEIGEPGPLGTPRSCPGLHRVCFNFTFTLNFLVYYDIVLCSGLESGSNAYFYLRLLLKQYFRCLLGELLCISL